VPVSLNDFSDEINFSENEIKKSIISSLPEDICLINSISNAFLILKADKEKITANVLKNIGNYHKRNPFLEKGRTFDELLGIVSGNSKKLWTDVLKEILRELSRNKKIKQVEHTWALINHSVRLDEKDREEIHFIENYFKEANMHTPLMSDFNGAAKQNGIDERKMNQILSMLVAEGKLYRVEENYLHSSIVNESRNRLLNFLSNKTEGITVAGFRDLIKGNRKICLLMLNLFDSEGITYRDGDFRKITELGRNLIKENG
jgi:selenocysteine-specific elongation factor